MKENKFKVHQDGDGPLWVMASYRSDIVVQKEKNLMLMVLRISNLIYKLIKFRINSKN